VFKVILAGLISGTSDPYVKFKVGGKQMYRSRTIFKNLNPKWEERFTIPMDDVVRQIKVKVYDYDRGLTDDAMGEAFIEPSDLKINE
jgi:Ca2+-dependent lipid-binding protein